MEKYGSIYGLKNPLTDKFYYVGQTKKALHSRLRGHIGASKTKTQGSCLVTKEIIEHSKRPEIILLEKVVCSCEKEITLELDKLERKWIKQLLSDGYLLTNKQKVITKILKNRNSMETICKFCLKQFTAKRNTAMFCCATHRVYFNNLTSDEKLIKQHDFREAQKYILLSESNFNISKASELPEKVKEIEADRIWIGIREYCKKHNITPADLIELHESQSLKAVFNKSKKEDKEEKKEPKNMDFRERQKLKAQGLL